MIHAMKKSLLTLVFAAAIVSSAKAQFERSSDYSSSHQRRALESTVRLRVLKDEGTSQGTGACIGYRNGCSYILTAEHVIRGARAVQVEVFSPESYPKPARVYRPQFKYWGHPGTDVGLLVIPVILPRAVPIASHDALRPGDPVLSVGCGAGSPPNCRVARVSVLDPVGDPSFDRESIPGHSGSAVLNPRGVIGILARANGRHTAFVSLAKVHSFLGQIDHEWLIP